MSALHTTLVNFRALPVIQKEQVNKQSSSSSHLRNPATRQPGLQCPSADKTPCTSPHHPPPAPANTEAGHVACSLVLTSLQECPPKNTHLLQEHSGSEHHKLCQNSGSYLETLPSQNTPMCPHPVRAKSSYL